MNVIITAEVTYEIQDVKSIDDVKDIFLTCVTAEARHMEGVTHIGIKEAFATEMNEDGTINSNPQIWATASRVRRHSRQGIRTRVFSWSGRQGSLLHQ